MLEHYIMFLGGKKNGRNEQSGKHGEKKEKGGGGLGGKITPSSVLVIKDGNARLVNIKNQDTITKLLDMVPELLDKFTTPKEDKVTEADVSEMLDSVEK